MDVMLQNLDQLQNIKGGLFLNGHLSRTVKMLENVRTLQINQARAIEDDTLRPTVRRQLLAEKIWQIRALGVLLGRLRQPCLAEKGD